MLCIIKNNRARHPKAVHTTRKTQKQTSQWYYSLEITVHATRNKKQEKFVIGVVIKKTDSQHRRTKGYWPNRFLQHATCTQTNTNSKQPRHVGKHPKNNSQNRCTNGYWPNRCRLHAMEANCKQPRHVSDWPNRFLQHTICTQTEESNVGTLTVRAEAQKVINRIDFCTTQQAHTREQIANNQDTPANIRRTTVNTEAQKAIERIDFGSKRQEQIRKQLTNNQDMSANIRRTTINTDAQNAVDRIDF